MHHWENIKKNVNFVLDKKLIIIYDKISYKEPNIKTLKKSFQSINYLEGILKSAINKKNNSD